MNLVTNGGVGRSNLDVGRGHAAVADESAEQPGIFYDSVADVNLSGKGNSLSERKLSSLGPPIKRQEWMLARHVNLPSRTGRHANTRHRDGHVRLRRERRLELPRRHIEGEHLSPSPLLDRNASAVCPQHQRTGARRLPVTTSGIDTQQAMVVDQICPLDVMVNGHELPVERCLRRAGQELIGVERQIRSRQKRLHLVPLLRHPSHL